MTEAIFFYIFALITIITTIMVIVSKTPISSIINLILSFMALSALYIMLNAYFIAALQVLVYAGAIMVLFIFVIMMLNLKPQKQKTGIKGTLILFAITVTCLLSTFFILSFSKLPANEFIPTKDQFGSARSVGALLFSDYVIPFELIGLLLLLGIIGAITLGSDDKKEQKEQ